MRQSHGCNNSYLLRSSIIEFQETASDTTRVDLLDSVKGHPLNNWQSDPVNLLNSGWVNALDKHCPSTAVRHIDLLAIEARL